MLVDHGHTDVRVPSYGHEVCCCGPSTSESCEGCVPQLMPFKIGNPSSCTSPPEGAPERVLMLINSAVRVRAREHKGLHASPGVGALR